MSKIRCVIVLLCLIAPAQVQPKPKLTSEHHRLGSNTKQTAIAI